ncbi:MAG: DUF4065 domain-containing protein [Nitrosopumilus sp.]|nr:DUF4065 domain-containing protein [Nitrosopumilus sp.]
MEEATGGPPYEPPYDPIMIRDYILCKGGGDLDKLQVIKIASIAYGYVLAMTNKRLFRGGVEAWAYGPVVPAIYETLKEYNGRIGELPYSATGFGNDAGIDSSLAYIEARLTDQVRVILGAVVERYGRLSGSELHRLTHIKGSPWEKSYRRGEQHTPIPDEVIRGYYEGLAG